VMLEAERNFRKVADYRVLARLGAALRAHDTAIDRGVDNRILAA
jgi:hypothetical protein